MKWLYVVLALYVTFAASENPDGKTYLYLCIHSLYIYKDVLFPAQAEYSYFWADFRLKIFLYYS